MGRGTTSTALTAPYNNPAIVQMARFGSSECDIPNTYTFTQQRPSLLAMYTPAVCVHTTENPSHCPVTVGVDHTDTRNDSCGMPLGRASRCSATTPSYDRPQRYRPSPLR